MLAIIVSELSRFPLKLSVANFDGTKFEKPSNTLVALFNLFSMINLLVLLLLNEIRTADTLLEEELAKFLIIL